MEMKTARIMELRGSVFLLSTIFLVASGAYAQKPPSSADQPAAAPKASDPLRRDTPYGTVTGFIRAAEQKDFVRAARYLQIARRQPSQRDEETARQLADVLDRVYFGTLDSVSREPTGNLEDGLPADRESFGRVRTLGDRTLDLLLVQVADSEQGRIWLVSSETTRHVGDFSKAMPFTAFERRLPAWLVRTEFLSLALWEWVAVLAALVIAWLLARMLIALLAWILRRFRHLTGEEPEQRKPLAMAPLTLALTVILHYLLVLPVLPLLYLQHYRRVVMIMFGVAIYWLISRAMDQAVYRIQERLPVSRQAAAHSILKLGNRILKALVALLLLLLFLKSFGFDVDSAIAGLGIGTLAIGFGAQKTLENLFGGVSVLSDGTIRVGDFCKVGDQTGTIEDIGLRATRVRTTARTLVSVPNGLVASMSLENYTEREKILFNPTISLRYETSADQLRYAIVRIRELLYQHPSVESETARVRFVGLGASSLNLQAFAYVLTADYVRFLAVQEDLLLRIMDIVEESGSGFAFPSHTAYLGKDTGLDPEKAGAALRAVRQWREEKSLPFPDHDPDTIGRLKKTLDFPPSGSASEKPQG